MHQTYLAQFELQNHLVVATVIDRDAFGEVLEGQGRSVYDAVADALHSAKLRFASENDELDACIAAMRDKRLHFQLHADGSLVSLGFA